MLCSGPGPLWDDCEGLAEESSDDARPHSRVLCRVQDTGRVGLLLTLCPHEEGHNALYSRLIIYIMVHKGEKSYRILYFYIDSTVT